MKDPIVFEANEERELINALADRTLPHSNLNRHVLRTVISHIFKKCLIDINDYRVKQNAKEAAELGQGSEKDANTV